MQGLLKTQHSPIIFKNRRDPPKTRGLFEELLLEKGGDSLRLNRRRSTAPIVEA